VHALGFCFFAWWLFSDTVDMLKFHFFFVSETIKILCSLNNLAWQCFFSPHSNDSCYGLLDRVFESVVAVVF